MSFSHCPYATHFKNNFLLVTLLPNKFSSVLHSFEGYFEVQSVTYVPEFKKKYTHETVNSQIMVSVSESSLWKQVLELKQNFFWHSKYSAGFPMLLVVLPAQDLLLGHCQQLAEVCFPPLHLEEAPSVTASSVSCFRRQLSWVC